MDHDQVERHDWVPGFPDGWSTRMGVGNVPIGNKNVTLLHLKNTINMPQNKRKMSICNHIY
jgi:hypothetical protein